MLVSGAMHSIIFKMYDRLDTGLQFSICNYGPAFFNNGCNMAFLSLLVKSPVARDLFTISDILGAKIISVCF